MSSRPLKLKAVAAASPRSPLPSLTPASFLFPPKKKRSRPSSKLQNYYLDLDLVPVLIFFRIKRVLLNKICTLLSTIQAVRRRRNYSGSPRQRVNLYLELRLFLTSISVKSAKCNSVLLQRDTGDIFQSRFSVAPDKIFGCPYWPTRSIYALNEYSRIIALLFELLFPLVSRIFSVAYLWAQRYSIN